LNGNLTLADEDYDDDAIDEYDVQMFTHWRIVLRIFAAAGVVIGAWALLSGWYFQAVCMFIVAGVCLWAQWGYTDILHDLNTRKFAEVQHDD
jgi:uncharacterized membrane protein